MRCKNSDINTHAARDMATVLLVGVFFTTPIMAGNDGLGVN